jgi:hypothetical protein
MKLKADKLPIFELFSKNRIHKNLNNLYFMLKKSIAKSIKLLYFFILLLISTTNGYAKNHHHHIETVRFTDTIVKKESISNPRDLQTVYVCTGSYAYAYHSRSDCPGLGNCKNEIKYTDENNAANNMGRIPCCRCWSNVNGRCKDDNPYNAGSGGGTNNSEAYGYIAIAVVAASAVILSNDMYVYPTYSFYKSSGNFIPYSSVSTISNSSSWSFGFRKTFEHSALEYGTSYMKSTIEYDDGYGNFYTYETDRWGLHLNYVHQVFYNKTPYWLNIYLGPSINYVYDFGYGGIVGTEMKVFDRLKFDIRYEYTTQTNQIQAGLIFTYQKKYFWQK